MIHAREALETLDSLDQDSLKPLLKRVDEPPTVKDPPPFDLARAHALYKALFGQVEDVIAGKRLQRTTLVLVDLVRVGVGRWRQFFRTSPTFRRPHGA